MIQILKYFFITMGVFFTAILVFVGYVWFFDVWQIRTGLTNMFTTFEARDIVNGNGAIDFDSLPEDVFSEERVDCYTKILGQDRVNEISAGAVPTPSELLSLSSCLD